MCAEEEEKKKKKKKKKVQQFSLKHNERTNSITKKPQKKA